MGYGLPDVGVGRVRGACLWLSRSKYTIGVSPLHRGVCVGVGGYSLYLSPFKYISNYDLNYINYIKMNSDST